MEKQIPIIQSNIIRIQQSLYLHDYEERIRILESSVHDINDCIYWIKKEREGIYE